MITTMESLFFTKVTKILILSVALQFNSVLFHTDALIFKTTSWHGNPSKWRLYSQSTKVIERIRKGCILSDLPTPCLLLEMSLAESATAEIGLDTALRQISDKEVSLDGSLFVHTTVTDTSERDQITKTLGSGKSSVICKVDTSPDLIPGGAYLGIGLANHHVGGYYWARGMGMGASLPAHGVEFGVSASSSPMSKDNATIDTCNEGGQLFWRRRGPGLDAKETTEESSNSNDGKRSEWADFLSVGDRVDLVPNNAMEVLRDSPFQVLIGVRRQGRPLGADPIVERIWLRCSDTDGGWNLQE